MAQRPLSARSRSAWDDGHQGAYDNPGMYDEPGMRSPSRTSIISEPPLSGEGTSAPEDQDVQVLARDPPSGCCYNFLKGVRALWQTRQTVDPNNREKQVATTLRELIIYMIFIAVITIVSLGMASPTMFYYNKVLSELFLDNNLADSSSTFRDMTNMMDVWRFAEGPLLDGLFQEKWYNGQNLSSDDLGYIYGENKMLGVARMRQLKVRNDSCTVHSDFENQIKACYDVYSEYIESKEDFGLAIGNTTDKTMIEAWRYQSKKDIDAGSHWGIISSYGGGGYIQNLATNRAKSEAIIQELKDNLWVDRGTRAVFFDFTVYNANINLFCVIRLVIELPATGGAFSSFSFRTVKLIRYVTGMDYFIMACEGVFVLFILYYMIEEAIEIKKHKLSYFKTFWNILDILVIIDALICVLFNVYRTMAVSKKLDTLLEDPETFADFEFLSYWQVQFNSAIAVMTFMAWIKVFKYISFNKTMNQLSSTLSACAADLGGFAVMFSIVFLAFAQLGYLIFGTQVADFSSFGNSVYTLFRIILGDFDFQALESANRILGPIYFIMYIFFVFFILLNMFLAIIADTYAEVKADLANQKNEFEMGDYFKKGYDNILGKLNIKRDKIVDIQKAMALADSDGNNKLDFDEWRGELKTRGYAEAEIEAVFAKYDLDGDRTLDLAEQQAMTDELNNERASCEKEIGENQEEEEEDGESKVVVKGVSYDEFVTLSRRVDRMEHSVGSIVSKIDAVLVKLEAMERAKTKRRETMSKILDSINEFDGTNDEQVQKLVRDELVGLDSESGSSLGIGSARARSRPSSAAGQSEV